MVKEQLLNPLLEEVEEDEEYLTLSPDRRLPPFEMKGDFKNMIQPLVQGSLVIVYGGRRAHKLVDQLLFNGVESLYGNPTSELGLVDRSGLNDGQIRHFEGPAAPVIPTHNRFGGPLTILDVLESCRTLPNIAHWFARVSDALTPGGRYVVVADKSMDADFLIEFLSHLGGVCGWKPLLQEGTSRCYPEEPQYCSPGAQRHDRIIEIHYVLFMLEKGPESDMKLAQNQKLIQEELAWF